ncbi:hypothetical protein [Mahella australiensis]|uniref:Uncharacterized protein n=1 Tax=Mahella australiensis (strain DSM 15567 / CIP 107919 / 50-1 BON) TaxID=697281 RepID=F4A0X2_MAHA5|nr:hypothetical protein [Mahella australiensis]AEE98049.1 hypothetical protein Mahau_2928 [Mahella australiensis 50-1 BON]
MRRLFKKYWLYIVALGIGLVLMPFAIHSAYEARGYFAIGGEWLVLPLALLVTGLIDSVKTTLQEIKKDA